MGSNISYIETMERYQDNKAQIKQLLASILETVTDSDLLYDQEYQQSAVNDLAKVYPYTDMLYALSPSGMQLFDNTVTPRAKRKLKQKNAGVDLDRQHRPYFLQAKKSDTAVVTEPYLSITDGSLVVSAARKIIGDDGELAGYMVCDFDVIELVSALMGDAKRKKFLPFFNTVYTIIVCGLMLVMSMLLFTAFQEITHFFSDIQSSSLRPFTAIIFLTLALSIFDLAKTVLEEEVLMHKDIFRHSSTRRTITRFISAILIAVSIEALLLMFKSSLGDGKHLVEAVWMMLGAVGLLIGLGFYVYMGAKAEQVLLETKRAAKQQR